MNKDYLKLKTLIEQMVRKTLTEENSKRKVQWISKNWESGPVTVTALVNPGHQSSIDSPPEYPSAEILNFVTKEGKPMKLDDWIHLENNTRQNMGEEILPDENIVAKLEEEALEADENLDLGMP